MAVPQLDIDRLSPRERIEFAERLWDSLREVPEEIPLTASQEEEIDRRLQAYRDDADPGQPWSEELAKIGKNTDRCRHLPYAEPEAGEATVSWRKTPLGLSTK